MTLDATGTARFSECGRYRYELRRTWGDGPVAVWVGLNPSTADAENDDPTMRRVRAFSAREGCGGFVMLNLFAWRSTDPSKLPDLGEAVGPENFDTFERVLREPGIEFAVAAWGAWSPRGKLADLFSVHTELIRIHVETRGHAVRCLGRTKHGAPRHPLYVKGDAPLVEYAA